MDKDQGGWPAQLALGASAWVLVFLADYLVATGIFRFAGIVDRLPAVVLAAATTVVVVAWGLRSNRGVLFFAAIVALLCIFAAIFAASMVMDLSYDGPAYHLPGALDVQMGWNPVYSKPHFWTELHYPNGLWTLQALFLSLGQGIETGKAPGILLALASMPFALLALRSLRGEWSFFVWAAFAALYANPVLVFQLMTFEADGPVFLLAVIQIAAAILLPTTERRWALIGGASALIILVNVKITGVYWAGLIAAATVLQAWMSGRRFPVAVFGMLASAGLVAVIVVGWRPYLTELLEGGDLLKIGASIASGPSNIVDAGPLTRFAYLLFGQTGNPAAGEMASLKWPWLLSAADFQGLSDIRIGGFGPWFGLQICAACVVALSAGVWGQQSRPAAAWRGPYWAGILLLAAFCFPVAWWARLVSPLWAAAPLLLAGWTVNSRTAWQTGRAVAGGGLLVCALLVNGAAGVSSAFKVIDADRAAARLLKRVADEDETIVIVPTNPDPAKFDRTDFVWMLRLTERAVKSRPAEASFPCHFHVLASGSVHLCLEEQR